MSMRDAQFDHFLIHVGEELERAVKKFPNSDCCLAALTEEVGELAKAMLSENRARIYAEAMQVAAMAARCAVEFDPSLQGYRDRNGFGLPL